MTTVVGTLEDLWKRGGLRDLEGDLDRFIRDNLGEIRRTLNEGKVAGLEMARSRFNKGELSDRQLIDFCVRSILRKRGTCNARRDIEEQRFEIEKEVWYEGERRKAPVPTDYRQQIALSWAQSHALKWREWRLYQLLYLWDKKAEEYVRMISSGQIS